MDDKSPEINSDPDEFQSLEDYERSPESSRSVEMGQMGNLDVNPPRPGEHSPSDDEDDVNLENFRVEFGGGAQEQPDPDSPALISDVEANEEEEEEGEVPANLYLDVSVGDDKQVDEPENKEDGDGLDEDQEPRDEGVEIDEGEQEEEEEPSSSSVPFHKGSLEVENVLETRDVEVEEEEEEANEEDEENEGEAEKSELDVQDQEDQEEEPGDEEAEDEPSGDDTDRDEVKETEREGEREMETEEEDNLTSRSTGRKRGRPMFGSEDTSRVPQLDSSRETDRSARERTGRGDNEETQRSRVDSERQRSSREERVGNDTRGSAGGTTTSSGSSVLVKPKRFMTPGAVIYNYERGRLSRREAFEILQEAKRSKMLHKSTDKVYIDKEGDVRIPRGYSFGRSRASDGRIKRKHGLTRIDREIQAYQKSTHMLIPRAIFARIVREIAQGWFKGEGQIKFTVEALAALQTAAEDEMVRLLETSMVCSRHAKRITLRVEDVRLARFCRGRQLYEFNNMEM